MREYAAQAVILEKEPLRDYDSRITFFTEKFGKLTGRATSARKITSKLSAHLEPGNMVNMRFVEKHGLQIVDSIKTRHTGITAPDLYALQQILGEGEPDPELWLLIKKSKFTWRDTLRILGWDAERSVCVHCGHSSAAFHIPRQEMYCTDCASKLPSGQVIYV